MAMTTTPSSNEPEAHGPDGRQGGRRGRPGRLQRVWKRRASRLAVGVVAAAVALTAAAVAFAQGIGQFRDVPANHYARRRRAVGRPEQDHVWMSRRHVLLPRDGQ